jgi:hypothetical protein
LIEQKQIMSWEMELDESILEDLYIWIDSLPLSRPKKRIERDFSDGNLLFISFFKFHFQFNSRYISG